MEVVVVGSCNMDLISYVPRLPKPGETLQGSKFSLGFGGKGANQCVMASRLGARTAMVAKLGNDVFGNNYLENLKENNINTDCVSITEESTTGVAPISVDDQGQNSIVIVSGANMLLNDEDICSAEDTIKSSKVMVCQLEIEPSTTLAAMKMAKKHGVTTILNPAPGLSNLDPDMYTVCDIFCPNETEAEILTGLPVTNMEEAYRALGVLLDKGCKKAILTMGDQGVVYASIDDRSGKHVPTKNVKPIDTTGAGDAFVGALAFYLACYPELGFTESLRHSCEIAAISVQSPGTQLSYPWRKDLPVELF